MEQSAFTQLESPRLRIRRFRADDAEAFARYRSDAEVARYQAWDVPYSIEEAQRFIERLASVSPGRAGTWFQFAVVLDSSGSLIGDCALRTSRADSRQAELGFSFATTYQRRGYAAEAVQCVLRYAFTRACRRRLPPTTS